MIAGHQIVPATAHKTTHNHDPCHGYNRPDVIIRDCQSRCLLFQVCIQHTGVIFGGHRRPRLKLKGINR